MHYFLGDVSDKDNAGWFESPEDVQLLQPDEWARVLENSFRLPGAYVPYMAGGEMVSRSSFVLPEPSVAADLWLKRYCSLCRWYYVQPSLLRTDSEFVFFFLNRKWCL